MKSAIPILMLTWILPSILAVPQNLSLQKTRSMGKSPNK